MKSKARIIRAFIWKETIKSWGLIVFSFFVLLINLIFNYFIIDKAKNDATLKSETTLIIVNIAILIFWILLFQTWFSRKFFHNHFEQQIINLERTSFISNWKIFSIRMVINFWVATIFILTLFCVTVSMVLVRNFENFNIYLKMFYPIFFTAGIINLLFFGLMVLFEMTLPWLFPSIVATLFAITLSISGLSANLHFQTTQKKDSPRDDLIARNLSRQTIGIETVVDIYELSEVNEFVEDLIKSFEFWDYAFKLKSCNQECKIENDYKNELYSSVFNDYLFLDIDKKTGDNNDFEINWEIIDGSIKWGNDMVSKKLRPLEVFYDINQSLRDYYLENKFSQTRENDWKNSLFNLERKNIKDIKLNPFNNDQILIALKEIRETKTLSLNYSNEDIIQFYDYANTFINDYSYFNTSSLSPLDLNQTNSEDFFYNSLQNNNANKEHLLFNSSSGERVLTGTMLSMIRNAYNYNFNLWNEPDLNRYIKKQKTSVGINYMSQFWLMSNFGWYNNQIEYHKSNPKIGAMANKYYKVEFKEGYAPEEFIVRNQVNEYAQRMVKIDSFKKSIVPVWTLYFTWIAVALLTISIGYLEFHKKIVKRR
ncbi:hypothetical protein [Spiroplasma endosymbiont of Panorpa germanica]|uniref:hypothetical protein n=1 Tax=Spiroplasma endosymbiont of Panorpa germanica TaxID=3066314 RepID=UPI0030D2566B